MPAAKTWAQALADGVDVRGPDECWPWTKATDREGYGQIGLRRGEVCGPRGKRKVVKRGAHVVAFEVATGAPPEDQALHTCDNPPCCNPAHLYDGTPDSNAQDRVRAGTVRSLPVLTAEHVATIRAEHDGSFACTRAMAERYGVSTRSIANVVSERTWKIA